MRIIGCDLHAAQQTIAMLDRDTGRSSRERCRTRGRRCGTSTLACRCFETLCRLLVLGMGYEMVVQHGKLEIPTKKGSMTLQEFERMANAAKRDHISKMAIGDLFLPVLDADFRNGIGHHSAHYEQEPDAIVIFDSKDSGTVSRVVG